MLVQLALCVQLPAESLIFSVLLKCFVGPSTCLKGNNNKVNLRQASPGWERCNQHISELNDITKRLTVWLSLAVNFSANNLLQFVYVIEQFQHRCRHAQ